MDCTEAIAEMMEQFRNNPPQTLAVQKVIQYLIMKNRKAAIYFRPINAYSFTKSNVLQFILDDGSK